MKQLTQKDKDEITKISQDFASGFKETFPTINGSGWLIVDPLASYLSYGGYDNKLHQIPENDKNPLVLIIEFADGSQFIPAGADLIKVIPNATNWYWL